MSEEQESIRLGDGNSAGEEKETDDKFLTSVGATGKKPKDKKETESMLAGFAKTILVLLLIAIVALVALPAVKNYLTLKRLYGGGEESQSVGFLDPGKKLVGVWTGSWNGWNKTDFCFRSDGTGFLNGSNGMFNCYQDFHWKVDGDSVSIISKQSSEEIGGKYEFQDKILIIQHKVGGPTCYTKKGESTGS